ncbi:hypothetical protein [Actinomadura nitritigenes]|uniref:hypothetical protein n=1 Tax=Actinomadura nitritigenes TaxID=134602 RepID=UPI003D928ED4
MLSDAAGLSLVVGVSAANTADIEAFEPLFMALPLIRSRRGPRRRRPDKARADKGYDSVNCAPGCAAVVSRRASRAAASNPASGSAGTVGRSSARSPGSSAAAGSPSATDARPTCSPRSSPLPPRSPAGSSLPRDAFA